uniref:Uncharacterized protein n=1 Tax=Chromera velia CCMP2878 TaxID=1169474 RepID=A0A0G4HWY5_9ALVE|eukprot:Cvel_9156.t1-p1 / transcript=Cvel_9156.t1 / gene=Cvel_9156 / organism=Chromera_velia_CCMP2878 / gene_product=hypothetical protein / transcript_product=hypothetical protein / location=Cvel_scaffold521:32528-33664(+) / protein_length=379 / sequence_SO=supercontig / SO=protein_coding / is_pseudo=false
MALSEILDVPGSDVIFPCLVPFLSLLELVRLRGSSRSVRRDIDGSAELTARTREAWVAFPDQSAIPSRRQQDFPNLLRVISRWFGGDRRVLRGLLSGGGESSTEGWWGGGGEREPLFISPPSPLKFQSGPDASLPPCLVTRLCDITHVDTVRADFASLNSVLEFDHEGRSFALAMVNVPLFPDPNDEEGDSLFARVFECPEDDHFDRIRTAMAEDEEYIEKSVLDGDDRWRRFVPGTAPLTPTHFAVSVVKWEMSLWDWRRSSFVSRQFVTVRRSGPNDEPDAAVENFCAPFDSDDPAHQEVLYPYAGEHRRQRDLSQDLLYAEPQYVTFGASAASRRGFFSGPSEIVVARVKILKFVDWCAGRKRQSECGGRPLHCTV